MDIECKSELAYLNHVSGRGCTTFARRRQQSVLGDLRNPLEKIVPGQVEPPIADVSCTFLTGSRGNSERATRKPGACISWLEENRRFFSFLYSVTDEKVAHKTESRKSFC